LGKDYISRSVTQLGWERERFVMGDWDGRVNKARRGKKGAGAKPKGGKGKKKTVRRQKATPTATKGESQASPIRLDKSRRKTHNPSKTVASPRRTKEERRSKTNTVT